MRSDQGWRSYAGGPAGGDIWEDARHAACFCQLPPSGMDVTYHLYLPYGIGTYLPGTYSFYFKIVGFLVSYVFSVARPFFLLQKVSSAFLNFDDFYLQRFFSTKIYPRYLTILVLIVGSNPWIWILWNSMDTELSIKDLCISLTNTTYIFKI